MPVVQHKHEEGCEWRDNGYVHYLVEAAPDILWYDVQDVGSYQGSVYAVGKYQGKIVIYENGYGSCGGCGAWGEGGEPTSQEEVLKSSKLFETKEEALRYLPNIQDYDKPDFTQMQKAIDEIFPPDLPREQVRGHSC